jgi:polyphosphate kinase
MHNQTRRKQPSRKRSMQKEPPVAFADPALYINRELSWLEFNQRVLEEGQDSKNPLLERLKFLCIVASNLDEFFEVRVAGLKQQRLSDISAPGPDALSPSEQLAAVSVRVRKMVDDQYCLWNDELVPSLEQNSIFFLRYDELTDEEKKHYTEYFEKSVYPVLTPLAVDPVHPFPQLLNKSLNVAVELEGAELNTNLAVVQVPRHQKQRSLPRRGRDRQLAEGNRA